MAAVAWLRRAWSGGSARMDLLRMGAALFVSFMLHDALQETLAHGANLHAAPATLTMLDFLGCTFWSWLAIKWTAHARRQAAAVSASSLELVTIDSSTHKHDVEIGRKASPPATPAHSLTTYFLLGLLILASNLLGIEALRFVDYPLKVILRSCKLIPTMIIGRLILGRRYDWVQYAAASSLCLGVILFSLADVNISLSSLPSAAGSGADASLMLFGIALLSASVVVDAVNPNVAEYIMTRSGSSGSKPQHGHGQDPESVNEYMFHTNGAALIVPALIMLYNRELESVLPVLLHRPSVLGLMLLYSSASYAGVNAYTGLIKRHGSATAVGLATLRKIATLICSYVFIPGATVNMPPVGRPLTPDGGVTLPLAQPPNGKHFGTAQLLPSTLILLGLMLSVWIERRKKGSGASASGAKHEEEEPCPSPSVTAPLFSPSPSSRRLHVAQPDQPQRGENETALLPSSASFSSSPSLLAAAVDTRALARQLGLETDHEVDTECETDTEKADSSSRRIMSKHTHHFSATLEQALHDGEESEFI